MTVLSSTYFQITANYRLTLSLQMYIFFFFNDTATTEIYTLHIVGSVRCVQETGSITDRYHCSVLSLSMTQSYEHLQSTAKSLVGGASQNVMLLSLMNNLITGFADLKWM
eukprot:TRINITY_DN13888_c0_g1_i1.p5 TRINITY_DN13888_c0_g1~~TRINITY_DN13888_c0_g1_i1.p5  ORF type:complete len:110 (+),score=10.40 TRINITY_DN13888_c0_g1_i1:1-330(+)